MATDETCVPIEQPVMQSFVHILHLRFPAVRYPLAEEFLSNLSSRYQPVGLQFQRVPRYLDASIVSANWKNCT